MRELSPGSRYKPKRVPFPVARLETHPHGFGCPSYPPGGDLGDKKLQQPVSGAEHQEFTGGTVGSKVELGGKRGHHRHAAVAT